MFDGSVRVDAGSAGWNRRKSGSNEDISYIIVGVSVPTGWVTTPRVGVALTFFRLL